MKKRLAGLLASVLVLMGNMGITANAVNTSLSKSYRNAYKKILSQNKDFQGVYIGDLTGDSREELLVATNEFGAFTLYVPVGKKIKKYSFDVMSVWGFTKYIESDRTFICMNYYGHTTGAPYSISMETFAVKDDKTDRFTIVRDYADDGAGEPVCLVNGKKVSDESFSLSLNAMIAETARSSYIPLVKHNDDSLEYYEGEIIDISYDDYIEQMLG